MIHHTKLKSLELILENRCIYPGGTKAVHEQSGKRRPIFFESQDTHRKSDGGIAHRAGCNVAISLKVDHMKLEAETSENRIGLCHNGAGIILKPVALQNFLRVELYGIRGQSMTLWSHPGHELEYTPCPACAARGNQVLLPSGSHLCWIGDCQHPLTVNGRQDFARVYEVPGNVAGW